MKVHQIMFYDGHECPWPYTNVVFKERQKAVDHLKNNYAVAGTIPSEEPNKGGFYIVEVEVV